MLIYRYKYFCDKLNQVLATFMSIFCQNCQNHLCHFLLITKFLFWGSAYKQFFTWYLFPIIPSPLLFSSSRYSFWQSLYYLTSSIFYFPCFFCPHHSFQHINQQAFSSQPVTYPIYFYFSYNKHKCSLISSSLKSLFILFFILSVQLIILNLHIHI